MNTPLVISLNITCRNNLIIKSFKCPVYRPPVGIWGDSIHCYRNRTHSVSIALIGFILQYLTISFVDVISRESNSGLLKPIFIHVFILSAILRNMNNYIMHILY